MLHRIGAEAHQRVDLLADAHRPELGGHAGAGARREHERREHRRQLARQRDADQATTDDLLPKQLQRRSADSAATAPEKKPTSTTIGSDSKPTNCSWRTSSVP